MFLGFSASRSTSKQETAKERGEGWLYSWGFRSAQAMGAHTDSTTGSRQRSLVQPPALAIFMLTVQTPSQITTAVVLSTTRLQLLVVKTAASNPTNLSSGRSTGGKDEPTRVNYSQREGISSSSRIPGCQSLSYQL